MKSFFEVESDFKFEDLFFSRTNTKGVIQSGNSVFQRVSKYSWEEIIQKPHSVIRHPGMPRGVFHLFWEMILAGKPTGAYVVNKSKDGSYYWVYALASPIHDGFISIRLKPSSHLLETVKHKYAELLDLEQKQNLSPQASHDILLEEIRKLGFKDYVHFMTEALTTEIESRQQALGQDPIGAILNLREILDLGTQLQKKCEGIFSSYRKVAFVPLNLEVQSARIGQEAATLAVISRQYSEISTQLQKETEKFLNTGNLGNAIKENVQECQFDVCNLILTRELLNFFKNETEHAPIDKDVEMALLEKLGASRVEEVKKSLNNVKTVFAQFDVIFKEIRKLTTTLDIVGITGKIETAKIKQSSSELSGLLDDLMAYKTTVKQSLQEIDDIGKNLTTQTDEIKDELETYLKSFR